MNIKSAVELGAQAVLDHQQKHPECDGQPKLLAEEEERRGLAVSEMMPHGTPVTCVSPNRKNVA